MDPYTSPIMVFFDYKLIILILFKVDFVATL